MESSDLNENDSANETMYTTQKFGFGAVSFGPKVVVMGYVVMAHGVMAIRRQDDASRTSWPDSGIDFDAE